MLKDYGDPPLPNIQSLARAIKALDAHEWTETEKKGLYNFVKGYPEARTLNGQLLSSQADSILVGLKAEGLNDLGD